MSLERRIQRAEEQVATLAGAAPPDAEPFPDDAEAIALAEQFLARANALPPTMDPTPEGRIRAILRDRDTANAANQLARRLATLKAAERGQQQGYYV